MSVDPVRDDPVVNLPAVQLAGRKEANEAGVPVMEGGHGVEQVGDEGRAVPYGRFPLAEGCNGVADGHGDTLGDARVNHPVLGVQLGGNGDDGGVVQQAVAVHVRNVLEACGWGDVPDKLRRVGAFLVLGDEGSLEVGPEDGGAVLAAGAPLDEGEHLVINGRWRGHQSWAERCDTYETNGILGFF